MNAADLEHELRQKYLVFKASTTVSFTWVFNQVTTIYPINRALLSRGGSAYLVSKMLEEGGELHRAFSNHIAKKSPLADVGTEIGDLLGWTISCWDRAGSGTSIDSELAGLFIAGCPTCKSAPCNCPDYSITPTQEDVIKEITKQLEELKAAGVELPVVDEATALATDVSTKDNSEKGKALAQKVEDLAKTAESAGKLTESVSAILVRLGRAGELLQTLF
jgi:hypothetical protein